MTTSLGCAAAGIPAATTRTAAAAIPESDLTMAILTISTPCLSNANRANSHSLEHHECIGGKPQVDDLARGQGHGSRLVHEHAHPLTIGEPCRHLRHGPLIDEPLDARLGRSLAGGGGEAHALGADGELDLLPHPE